MFKGEKKLSSSFSRFIYLQSESTKNKSEEKEKEARRGARDNPKHQNEADRKA